MRHRACKADQLGLGWRPGFTYFNGYWRRVDVVLGYDKNGSVIVRDDRTGVERSHMTPVSKSDQLVADIENIFGWSVAVTRSHREAVTA